MERVTGWMMGNAADVHDIHLPPEPFVGGINGDHASITADPQLRVDPKIAVTDVHAPVVFQLGQPGWPMKQEHILEAVDGIRVQDNPED